MNTFKAVLLTAPLSWQRKKMKHSFNLLFLLNSALFYNVMRNHSISGEDGEHGNHDTASIEYTFWFSSRSFECCSLPFGRLPIEDAALWFYCFFLSPHGRLERKNLFFFRGRSLGLKNGILVFGAYCSR